MEILRTQNEASLAEARTIGSPEWSPIPVGRFYGFTSREPLPRTVHPEAEMVYSAALRFGLLTESEICEAQRVFEFHTSTAVKEDRLGILAHALIACERAFWFDTERESPPEYMKLVCDFAGLSHGQFCPTFIYQHPNQTIGESGFGKHVIFQFLHDDFLFRTTFDDCGDWADTWKLIQASNAVLATKTGVERFVQLRHDGQCVCVAFTNPAVLDRVLEEIEASIEPQPTSESVLVESLQRIGEHMDQLQSGIYLKYCRDYITKDSGGALKDLSEVAVWRNREGETALHIIAASSLSTDFSRGLVRLLVSHGADIHAIDDSGRKPIDRIYRLPQAQFLMEFGADVTEQRRDKYGGTLLHRISYQAEDEEDLELLEYLLNAGVDVDLQTAQPNLAQELIDYKRSCFFLGIEYDPSRVRTAGGTPLHSAAKGGAEEAVKLLLKYGADPNIRNANAQLAMDIAELAGHHQIAQLLMQAMSE